MAASNSFYSSAPTVFMPPNNADQYFASSHYVDSNGHSGASSNTSPNAFESDNNAHSSCTSLVETPGSLAGRKRSRGDVHAPEDDKDDSASYKQAAGLHAIQENAAQRPFQLARPAHISRKSQRINLSSAESEDLATSASAPHTRDAAAEPRVDEATLALGISWTRMDSSEARQINQAAYAKWIKNYYPELRDVEVLFEYGNEEMPAYLVKAVSASDMQPEYYIFSHDLTEAHLVTRDPNELVPRLQMMPALNRVAHGKHIRANSHSTLPPNRHAENAAKAQAKVDEDEDEGTVYRSPREPPYLCAAHAMEMD